MHGWFLCADVCILCDDLSFYEILEGAANNIQSGYLLDLTIRIILNEGFVLLICLLGPSSLYILCFICVK